MLLFKSIYLGGMIITAIVIAIGLIIFRRPPIGEDLIVILVWPYFLCYAVSFISAGLWAFYKDRKQA